MRRAPSFPKAPFIVSMAISRILFQHFASKVLGMIIHLIQLLEPSSWTPGGLSSAMVRRYPRINRAGYPSSVLSCTARGFSCLANYFASGELLPRLFTLACAFLKEPAVCFL
jgi:hypothetical protein